MKAWIDDDIAAGLRHGVVIGLAIVVLVAPAHHPGPLPQPRMAATAAVRQPLPPVVLARRTPEFGVEQVSADVQRLAQWVIGTADNGPRAFAIIDKRNTRVFVFEADGRLRGASPVLLGYAAGDDSVSGIGKRPISAVRPQERTTPAGRFIAEPGHNAQGEDVVWIDYDAAVSMHRVRLNNPAEHRLERLATLTTADNRISYGCINLPVGFFDDVVWPAFRGHRSMVYVLPEQKALADVFPGLRDAAAPLAQERSAEQPTKPHSQS